MPLVLGSGNRTDYILKVTEAFFAPDAGYANGETTLLHLVGVDEDGEESKEMYNVGKDWISTDGGKTVHNLKGGTRISRNSMYGHFVDAIIGLGPEVVADIETRGENGDPSESVIWVGASFHLTEMEISFGRNIEPTFRNLPDEWFGYSDVPSTNGTSAAATKSTTAPKPAVSRPTALDPKARAAAAIAAKAAAESTPHPSSPLYETLQQLARESEDFESFVTAAVDIPGLTDDDEMSNLVFDPEDSGFYSLNRQ